MPGDMVNAQAVHILLECILVLEMFFDGFFQLDKNYQKTGYWLNLSVNPTNKKNYLNHGISETYASFSLIQYNWFS